ncbi:hypothetical protein OB955_02740 [Halobacteria archaeon AArc-m2/3/4]|uniref:Uncharacterized protein n=1 Tax=Natronoglomus mannanivorans TaxID=2979990 RepID=A0AAP3E0C5_9EURY|nr:hypothetical protein [Halobacteria archaeon AArc-xg1-1]MCU4971655.1 hypothetical protein [Halobacteria archaeon AArc-m2/3/4]
MTVALVGGLMFMGFAGTATAQDIEVGIDAEVDNEQEANAENNIAVAQENNNAQGQIASSYSSSDKSEATTVAVQGQDVDQSNAANVEDTTAIASNEADNEATGVNVDLDFDLDLDDDLFNGAFLGGL